MMEYLRKIAVILFVSLVAVSAAHAWHAKGKVYCDANQNGTIDGDDTRLEGVVVFVDGTDVMFFGSDTTDDVGYFSVALLDIDALYVETLDPSSLPADATIVVPAGGEYALDTSITTSPWRDWLIDSAICRDDDEEPGICWMTGGGVKFSPITGTNLAQKGPKDNMGGNVNPGCNDDTGAEGGHWNHVAHAVKLHFKGNPIDGVECGNVDGIPPGSESPVTPFNFIRYWGTGSLKGIKGNKVDHGTVHFTAYVEDRNEPGSNGASDGELVDRYFLHVFADPGNPAGTTLLLVDADGDPTTEDPVMITGGNLQLHDTPCEGSTAP